jgi:NAD(P)H-hydrate epimerase
MSISILTPAAMRRADSFAIRHVGIPGMVLMENAARAAADLALERWPGAQRVAILCGGGNNGGDGLAVARLLHAAGLEVRALLLVDPKRLAGDAARQLRIAGRFGVPVEAARSGSSFRGLGEFDLLIDALFGTGLARPVEGSFRAAVRAMNRASRPILALDIPSGLDGSRGEPPGEFVRADVTISFGAAKWAHVLPPACEACGELVVADIGIPAEAIERARAPRFGPAARLFDADDLDLVIPVRSRSAHKGDFGHLLLVAGGRGQAGAAILAARGALRSGIGLLTVASPAGIVPILQAAVPEAMCLPLPEGEDGRPSLAAAGTLREAFAGKSALAIGPGLGTGAGAAALVAEAHSFPRAMVVDADALNLLASGKGGRWHRPRGAPLAVLTPHPGEAARLLGAGSSGSVQADRPAAALELARRWQTVAVLKGEGTLIATPDGALGWNPTGTPGLATGGSGDVLAGVTGAFLARGIEPFEAASAAAWLHGRAGEEETAVRGEEGLAAGDLPDRIAEILGRRGR